MSEVDDDEPAVTAEMEPESPTGESPERDDSDDDDSFESEGASVAPGVVKLARGARPISAKTRELYASAAKSIAAQRAAENDLDQDDDTGYDELPVPIAAPAAGAPPAATVLPPSAATGLATATPPVVAPEERAKLDARHAELEAREQALTARERSSELTALRDGYIEHGAGSFRLVLEALNGGKLSDDEYRSEVTDLVTDLSLTVLGVEAPSEIKTRLEAKRALKAIKAHRLQLSTQEGERTKAAADVAQREQRVNAVHVLNRELSVDVNAKAYPWLSAEDSPGELVFVAAEAILKRTGQVPAWQDAAKEANEYLSKQGARWLDKRRHLSVADPKAGAAVEAKRPQVVDPQVARSQPPRTPPPQQTSPAPTGKWDPDAHRRATKQRFRAAFAAKRDE